MDEKPDFKNTFDISDYGPSKLQAAAPDLLKALKLAVYELNAIRARDGAPQHIDWHRGQPIQTSGCTDEWWSEVTEKCYAAILKADPENQD